MILLPLCVPILNELLPGVGRMFKVFWDRSERQGPTLVLWAQVELDKSTLQVALVKLTCHPRLWPLFKSLDKWQIVKSDCQVHLKGNPPKITSASCPKNSSRGVLGREVTVMAKKKVKIIHFFFWSKKFSMKMIFWELFCDVLHHETRLRLGSVAAALVNSPQHLNPGYVYKHIEKIDTDKRAYGWLPVMVSFSGIQIGALCVESFCERILSEANDVCQDRNTLLDTEEINMLVVLRMNRKFIQHMRDIWSKLSGQNLNGY